MRRRLNLLSLLLFVGVAAFSQQLKFGNVNTQEILMAMPELKAVQTQLETEYKQKETQLTTMQEDLQKQQESYMKVAETMSPEDRAAKEKELQQMGQKVQNFYMLAQQQLKAKEQELKMPLLQKVQAAIQEVGDENGFIYIFEVTSGVPIFHSEKSVDVTPLVKAKLGIKDVTATN